MTDRGLWVHRLVEERFHRDDEGRPVREGRTPSEYLRPDDIEWKPCLYPGSRHKQLRMNVSALRQMSAHWDEMLGTLGFLRSAYTAARGGYAGDLIDIWRVSQLGSALPWYFILRGHTSPAYAAALSKATLGVAIWGSRLLVKTREGWTPPARFSSRQMLDLAEQTGTLIAETEVCSGPEKMLLEMFDVLTEDAFPAECPLAAERDQVTTFAAHYLAYKQLLWVYCLMRRFLLADCRAALGDRDDVKELLAAPCEPLDFDPLEPPQPAAVPPPVRTMWFRTLVDMMVPLAPDRSDRAVADTCHRMADAMGDPMPPHLEAITREVAAKLADAQAVSAISRATATFIRLDCMFGEALAMAEAGMRRVDGAFEVPASRIDAAFRDRTQIAPPRRLFASFAPLAVAGSA